MNNELGSIWKETVPLSFQVPPHHFPWSIEENQWNPYTKTVIIPAEIRTVHLPNTLHKRYLVRQRPRSVS
jgi:hypothetical protein